MKKSYNPISDVRNESVELTRRLYRSILDVARHLDDRRGRSQTCSDLFSPSVEAQRLKLREYCERLIFTDPVGYGKKGEELLWRKGYYDVVTTAKHLRKNNSWSALEVAYMQSHLEAGVGHYHHLLFRLQIEFKLDLRGVVDFSLLVNDGGLMKDKPSSSANKADASSIEWAKQSVHRCLVYLGDLSRYILDLHPNWDNSLATRYYLQAQNMNTEVGMPHNQLGTLSGAKNYGLDAAYHYMRCLTCRQSFEGAEGNLQRLLHKTAEWLEQNHNSIDANSPPSEHIHRLIAHFLVLADTWFFNKHPLPNINQVYHEILLDLQQCLLYAKPFPCEGDLKEEESELEKVTFPHCTQQDLENPSYLTDEIAFKFIVVSLLCTSRLNPGSQEAAAAIAFTLAAFSQLIQQIIHHVQDSVLSLPLPPVESPPITPSPPSEELRITIEEPNSNGFSKTSTSDASQDQGITNEHCNSSESTTLVNGHDMEEKKKGKHATKRKKSSMLQRLRRRRRRRRRRLNSSEESDLSDGDFPFDECCSSDDGNSDISENLEPNGISSSEDEEEDDMIDDDEDDDDEDDEEDEEEEESLLNKPEQIESSESKIISNGDIHDHKDIEKCNGVTENGKDCNKDNVINADKSKLCSDATDIINTNDNLVHKALDPANIIELVAEEGLLSAVKVCADWLRCDPNILKSCGHSSRPLLLRIITLLNLIKVDATAFYKDSDNGHLFKLKNFEEVLSKVPLPEDVTLKGLPILKNIHENLDWDFLRHHRIHAKEEALLRICKLIEFGHFLTTIPETGVTYDEDQKLFKMCSEQDSSDNKDGDNGSSVKASTNEEDSSRKEQPASSRRGQLMHHMGQLWLRAEVRDLESRVRRRGATYSPYLAVDSDALIHHMHLVKQLVGARKFIILIPAVVVSALDELKREIGKARETIRWLESQFQRGNRFLRAQRSHERLPLPLMKYPKKKDKEAWLFFQVVECCHYFSQQTGVHERQPETALVTLLTGQKNALSGGAKEEVSKGFSPLGVAKSAGINLEYIESFHSKWKTSSKSHG